MNKLATIMFTSLALVLATALVVGAVEIRGEVATGDFTWNSQNFAGFYYDIDDNIGTEQITTTITEGNKLQEPTGIQYTTTAQKKAFEFEGWGYFNVVGFNAAPYFGGYVLDEEMPADDQVLYQKSTDECSLCDEQLEKVLINDDKEKTVTSGTPLKLEEGYELSIKSIDIDGNKVYLELTKDGAVVSSKVISPSMSGATMLDKTFYYKMDVGEQKGLVTIAVHFKNAFRGADQDLATIDGIFQISDTATDVKTDTEYGKMRIATVSADTITMDNQDNTITLSKNKILDLMDGTMIKTADADELRYYIYKTATVGNETMAVGVAKTELAAAKANVTAAEAVAATAEAKVNETKAAAAENVTAKAEAAKPANATAPAAAAPAAKGMPGFEGVLAITGLLAVAYLVLGRKQ
jgi:S-layer protein (TIGR01567 family)